jgi:7-carboxy-7-deazaguanine synthase
MSYQVKEIYLTLQGEGAQTGRAAVFLRFAGCNLWSGRDDDRASAICRFCDTDFVGTDGALGGKYQTAQELAQTVADLWPEQNDAQALVICTGGEPLLQLDDALIQVLHDKDFDIAVETNGTLHAPDGLDWICVSPKGSSTLKQNKGHEIKLVYPQTEPEAQPECFAHLDFEHFFLQPLAVIGDQEMSHSNLKACLAYCLAHPQWRLSLQTHKIIGID